MAVFLIYRKTALRFSVTKGDLILADHSHGVNCFSHDNAYVAAKKRYTDLIKELTGGKEMYCERCGKPLSEYTGNCEFCKNYPKIMTEIAASNAGVIKPSDIRERKHTMPVGLAVTIIIIVLILGISIVRELLIDMDRNLEYPRVSADMQLADNIHTAILTAMLDPEIVNKQGYLDDYNALTTEFDITQYRGDENCILAGAAEILGVEDFRELRDRIKSSGATGRILVTLTGPRQVWVVIEGTKSEGGEISVGYKGGEF